MRDIVENWVFQRKYDRIIAKEILKPMLRMRQIEYMRSKGKEFGKLSSQYHYETQRANANLKKGKANMQM